MEQDLDKKMEMIKDFRNELLKRREVNLIVSAESNPGFEKAMKSIAEMFRVEENRVVINNILSKFGSDSFLIDSFIYDSAHNMNSAKKKKEGK